MDNQYKLIKGYRDLSQAEIDSINSIKLAEQDIGQLWQQVSKVEGVDLRQMALAKTKLQEAFMWFIRGVAQPLDVFSLVLPEETFLDRLKTERVELDEKIVKLHAFTKTETFASLEQSAQKALSEQLTHMTDYLNVLNHRIESLG